MSLSQLFARSINQHFMSGFCIKHSQEPHIRQFFCARIIDLYGNHIVLTVGYFHFTKKIFPIIEITNNERSTATLHHSCQISSDHGNVCMLTFRMEIKKFTNNI